MKIVKIGAMWCPGCLVMKKIWNNILKDYENLEITELDYDIDNTMVSEYNVGNILPVVIFINNNNLELDRLIGEQKESKLRELIEKYKEK